MPDYEEEKKIGRPHRFTLLILIILGVSQVVGSWLFFQGMDHYDLMAQAYIMELVQVILLLFIAAELTIGRRQIQVEYFIPEKIPELQEVTISDDKKGKKA